MTLAANLFHLKTCFVRSRGMHQSYKLRFIVHPRKFSLFTSSRSEIVIEGFPRSANSYAANLFMSANPGVINIARHIHTISQIDVATRHNIPTLLLIRDPVGTISSFVKRFSEQDSQLLLRSYAQYYERIYAYRRDLVISDFPHTVSDLGPAIKELNLRYSKSFNLPNIENTLQVKEYLSSFSACGKGVKQLPPLGDPREIPAAKSLMADGNLLKAMEAYNKVKEFSVGHSA